MRRVFAYISLLLLCLLATLGGLARAAAQGETATPAGTANGAGERTGERDRKAKQLFTAGKYAEAIELLSQLYRETNNPIYLRNIGRSYQRMREPDRAIASFEEYLLRARNLSATEREEVRGFVREMEVLKRRQEAKSGTTSKPPAPMASDRPSEPAAVIPAPAPGWAPAASASSPGRTPSPPAPDAPTPVVAATSPSPFPSPSAAPPPQAAGMLGGAPSAMTSTPRTVEDFQTAPTQSSVGRTVGWVAAGVAGALAVGGGVALAMAWSTQNKAKSKSGCLVFMTCNDEIPQIESRNRLAKIFLGGAAVTAVLGATFILLNPAPAAGPDGGMAGMTLSIAGRF